MSLLVVTLGPRGAAYVSRPGFTTLAAHGDPSAATATIRTERIPAEAVDTLDPTGCGDVFGATCFARLLAGDRLEAALLRASRAAARNATFRGASGLARHLRGRLVEA